jgi:uncharacterized protein
MNEILKNGTFLETDAEGFLISDANVEKIRWPWTDALEFARRVEVVRLGERLHSLYLRGSVACGTALEGKSDLDLFAVLHDEDSAAGSPGPWPKEKLAEFYAQFPFVTSLETSHITLAAVHGHFHYYRFMMNISAVCVWGQDLLPEIPRYKADDPIAEEWFRIFPHLVDNFVEDLHNSDEEVRSKHLCHDMMKAFLRTGMFLVMRRHNGYTRDLYPSYLCFSQYYPDKEPTMQRCLEFAVNPIADAHILLPLVTDFAEWMREAGAIEFGDAELLPASLIR